MIETWIVGVLMGAIPALFIGIDIGKFLRKWEMEVPTATKTAENEIMKEILKVSSTRRELK